MKRFWTILLALFVLVPTLAQEDTASAAFERLIPSNVRLRLDEEAGASLVFNAEPAVCEPLISDVSIEGNVIDVDVYAPLSAEGQTCNFVAPFEPVIELGELEPDISYVLLLNDFVASFFVPQPEGVIMDMPFPMVWGEDNDLFGFTRVDSFLDTVEFSVSENDTIQAEITGSHPDGCESEAFTWMRQDDVNESVYYIEVFRLIPAGVMCPAMLQEFELSIDTGLATDGTYFIEAGDRWFSYNAEETTEVSNYFITVETVTVAPEGDGYSVSVVGWTPGCETEVTVVELAADYASFITISMFAPFDTPCTLELRNYEAVFTVDVLPVIINGLAYDENGAIPPRAQAAGRPDLGQGGGGNLMQVDTVIESVDVLILESFPMQLNLVVKGYQPDGCDLPVIVEQSREENVVTVHIYRELEPDVMCTMMIVPYEETIQIEGGFEGGTVEIHVNEFTTSVDL
jgi:inhibitor of cysteine peptidase